MQSIVIFIVSAALVFSVGQCISLRTDLDRLQEQITSLRKKHDIDVEELVKASQSNTSAILSNTSAIDSNMRTIQILVGAR